MIFGPGVSLRAISSHELCCSRYEEESYQWVFIAILFLYARVSDKDLPAHLFNLY